MSQGTLAKRARVPQSTISRLERGQENFELSTLRKILRAMSFDLVLAPVLQGSIDSIREEQAKKIAQKQVQYLSGTMNLEQQQPDPQFVESLLKQETERLLHGSGTQLWGE
jgi:transcriptional regulator with XRE-family HTH domain